MDYRRAVDYVASREWLGIKLGLDNIRCLVEALGHPEGAYPSILVAGTNGKGSTAALVESILRAAGYRTGRYTSPHLVRLEERIAIGGMPIGPDELAASVSRVAEAVARLREDGALLAEPTFFEVVTATAFEAFRRAGVEIAVLEVGMGGRWDATNVVDAAVSVVTNVAMDHERFLGTSLEAIAAEKAAIVKPGRLVVVGRLEPGPLAVVRAEARRRRARLVEALEGVRAVATERPEGGQGVALRTPVADYGTLALPLAGAHQVDNLVVAVRTVECARAALGLRLGPEDVARGVAATVWEARLERIAGRPDLLLDAAHNPAGCAALARYLAAHPAAGRRVLLFAAMRDKKVGAMLRALLPHVDAVVVTRPAVDRARAPAPVAAWLLRRGVAAEAVEPTAAALDRARERAGGDGEVVVAGSLFLAGEILRRVREERALSAAETATHSVG